MIGGAGGRADEREADDIFLRIERCEERVETVNHQELVGNEVGP